MNASSKWSVLLLIAFAGTLPCSLSHADESVDALVTLKTDVLIPARVAGVVEEINIQEGKIVERDEMLAKLDATLVTGDRVAAEREVEVFRLQKENDIDIRYSQKSRDVSERELQRSLRANDRFARSVSSTEIERLQMLVDQADLSGEKAKLDLDVAQANFQLKQALAKNAERRVELHHIVSPVRGMVVAKMVSAGEWLDVGQPVARVIQLDVLRVEANMDSARYGTDFVGSPVTLDVSGQAADGTRKTDSYKGKIVFVSPEVDPVDGRVRVWAEVENPKHQLKPGMRGRLTVATTTSESAE